MQFGLALLTFALLVAIWPTMIAGQTGRLAYWLGRSAPGIMLAAPALLTLLLVLVLPLHLRQAVALASLFVYGTIAANFALHEHARLAPYVSAIEMPWRRVLRFADVAVVAGTVIGFALCAVAARLSLNRGPSLKRTNMAAFGHADWMSTREAHALCPPNGGLVVGEAYRVDRDCRSPGLRAR